MNQDSLADQNILIVAIHPLRNVVLCDGSDSVELMSNILEAAPKLIPGFKKFIDEGWKGRRWQDEDKEDDNKEFWDLPESDKREFLQEWGLRNIPLDMLVAELSTPVPTYSLSSKTAYMFSWGYTALGYVAGENIQELYKSAHKWKEEIHTQAKAKGKTKKGKSK